MIFQALNLCNHPSVMKNLTHAICTLLVGCALLPARVSVAQSVNIDSLRTALRTSGDTTTVNMLNKLVRTIQFSIPSNAKQIARLNTALAERIHYTFGAAVAQTLHAVILLNQMNLDSAGMLLDKSSLLLEGLADEPAQEQKGIIINGYGFIFHQRQLYDSAVNCYLQAARIFEKNNNYRKLFFSYSNLSSVYDLLEDLDKTAHYARAAYAVAVKAHDPNILLRGYIILANAYADMGLPDSLESIARRGLLLAQQEKQPFAIAKLQQILGVYYHDKQKDYDSAIYYFTLALDPLIALNSQYDVALVLQNIGSAYRLKNDLINALHYSKRATELARSLDLYQVMHYSLADLVKAEEKLGHSTEALTYLKEYVAVNDTIQNRANRKRVNELEIKYQTENKEARILAQEASLQNKSILNYILAGSACTLLFIIALSFRTYKQKQHLQQQRIMRLENEKQLAAAEAVLKGEEQERSRLAKDLHDGLGSMLSGIKYSFSNIKETLIMTPDNVQAFGRSMDMLDSSIREMRRVAHNMMPEALVRFGLDAALNEFCSDITESGALEVDYMSIGITNDNLDQTTAVTLYRVVQELINNSVKHAAATTALVQIMKTERSLTVTVEDNGKGFDTARIDQSTGIGWSNIRHRIDFLKGRLDIDSRPGQGTSVHIEFDY